MQTAQHRALTLLTHLYPIEYRDFYLEEKIKALESNVSHKNSQAQSRAKIRLSKKFADKYKELYEEAAGKGYRRTHT